ncbi:MAG TPA: hypothetical protein VJN29_09625 [Intrasporangium sp.]|uniref:hypothetical protein n=1 Tax=Intrasporangium sp. TaxID=1925024 RepID=UPI002B480B17|nr:hypothetical protein [Intrasporangium sp.]HKX67471.1 hypothetical protein [Intrasporangium sp.]
MSRNKKRGGPGHGRGLPAPRSDGDRLGSEELREHLRRAVESAAGPRRPVDVLVTGTLSRAEVETHPLVLTDERGSAWELVLPAAWSLDASPGVRVTVRGDVIDEESATQVGPRLRVRSLSRAD